VYGGDEARRIRLIDDAAGDEHAWAGDEAASDAVARCDSMFGKAAGVADGRDAEVEQRTQRDARHLWIVLAAHLVGPGIQMLRTDAHVGVHVDEARHQILATSVDDAAACGRNVLGTRHDTLDDGVTDDHSDVGAGRGAGTVDHRDMNDGDVPNA